MKQKPEQGNPSSRDLIRGVMDACTNCDICRFMMDESCLFFPELYRLFDKEKEAGTNVTDEALKRLASLCTLCGLCPCPNIRADILLSKAARVREQGIRAGERLLADVQNACRLGGRFPWLINTFLSINPVEKITKRMGGISQKRALPRLPKENFFSWAQKNGLTRKPAGQPKAAYFAGCTAGFLFPEVARAAVAVLKQNHIAVYVPPQQCCGMPTLLEGMAALTRQRVQDNLRTLLDAADTGFDLVCTCPTCGFFMKKLLREGAHYSQAFQKSVSAGADEIRVPGKIGKEGYVSLKKSIYGDLLADNPNFSAIDPMARIALSEKLSDMGQYLERLHLKGLLDTNLGRINNRMVYFTPCHQREQNIGSPYENLLFMIPGLDLIHVGGDMDCCGMGGSLGFKEGFHGDSIRLGQPLAEKIKAASPYAIVTDCLSCRLQFRHLLPELPVYHPLELLASAYKNEKTIIRP